MIDLKSIKINNLKDHQIQGVYTGEPHSTYPIPEYKKERVPSIWVGKYLGVWILLLGPSTWGPGWRVYFRQISGGTSCRVACILIKLCPTFRSYSAPAQTSLYCQLLNNNTIPFCCFTLWASGPAGPPWRRPPPLCACGALSCGKQYKPTGLRVIAPQAHTESGPTEALWGAKAFAPISIENDYHL